MGEERLSDKKTWKELYEQLQVTHQEMHTDLKELIDTVDLYEDDCKCHVCQIIEKLREKWIKT